MNDIMAQAGELRRTGQAEEARKLLLKALEQQQNDAELWYQTAWTQEWTNFRITDRFGYFT
ncbi:MULTISPECIES: tetratricopeptide repeat protein [Paenibacillus]|jgi:hypothetical protein|nr:MULTISPECIES: tetratricopeptide repeat protein [Paenibacillus]MBP1308546.1 hypothetical protein [Paenibacillus sp. 1182]UMY56880.1 hypothetical protein MLD56_10740 [Paenibacillus peoriae]